MSAEHKYIDPTPLGNITTGIVLLTLWPILFELADTTGMIEVLPWSAMALSMATVFLGFCCMEINDLGLFQLMLPATLCINSICIMDVILWLCNAGTQCMGKKLLPY